MSFPRCNRRTSKMYVFPRKNTHFSWIELSSVFHVSVHLRTVFDIFSFSLRVFFEGAPLRRFFVNFDFIFLVHFSCILGARMRLQAGIALTCVFCSTLFYIFSFFRPILSIWGPPEPPKRDPKIVQKTSFFLTLALWTNFS